MQEPQFDSWVRKIPWRRDRLSTPVFGASLVTQTVKNMPAMRDPWVGKIHWRKEWLHTPSISYINHNILHFHQQQMRVLVAHQHLVLAVVPDFGHSKRRVVVCHFFFFFNLHFPNDVWLHTCIHAQVCPSLCDPSDWSPPGSFVHGISQARVLEWVAISYSRGCRDQTCISCVFCFGRRIVYRWATWEAPWYMMLSTFSYAYLYLCIYIIYICHLKCLFRSFAHLKIF